MVTAKKTTKKKTAKKTTTRLTKCARCQGFGVLVDMKPCPTCKGVGKKRV